jgi:hypothetical protein
MSAGIGMTVADFFEAADKNRDGLLDYKEYTALLSPDGEEESADNATEDQSGAAAVAGDAPAASAIPKVEPYGAEELREVMIKRRQALQAKDKAERLRQQAYKDALDLKGTIVYIYACVSCARIHSYSICVTNTLYHCSV